jgi:hypothetical protein
VAGFFSSGLGMGGGSGLAEGGCTVDGASGMSAFCAGWVCDGGACPLGVWLPEDCPCVAGTIAHTHPKTSAIAGHSALLHRFPLTAAISMITNTVRSFHELRSPSASSPTARINLRTLAWDARTHPFGASKLSGLDYQKALEGILACQDYPLTKDFSRL